MACNDKPYKSGFTLERLEALESAIAEGAKRVKYSDKEVEYHSIDEMLKLRDAIKRELCNSRRTKKSGLFGGSRLEMEFNKGL